MSKYPLRQLVRVKCHCCGLVRDMVFVSEQDQPICAVCMKHQGTDWVVVMRRDRAHQAEWHGVVDRVRADYQGRLNEAAEATTALQAEAAAREAEIEALQGEIERQELLLRHLRQTVRNGYALVPPELVKEWLIDEAINFAESEVRRVFRSRAHAYRALYALNELHRHVEGDLDRCACGLAASACPELRAIAPMEQILYQWERKQIEFAQRGLDHELPDDHPDAVRARKAKAEAERRRMTAAS